MRTMRNPLHSSFFGVDANRHTTETLWIRLEVPPGARSLEQWLDWVAASAGLTSLEKAEQSMEQELPDKRMIVRPCPKIMMPAEHPREILLAALILARTNETRYLRTAQPVFTRKRLDRTITLSHVELASYYGLEEFGERIEATKGRTLVDHNSRSAER